MKRIFPALSLAYILLTSCIQQQQYDTWKITAGSKENIRYSTLVQIDTSNVKDLQVAWIYHSADADTVNHSQIQCNPIIVDGILYGTTPQLSLVAINAATGVQQWKFDPREQIKNPNLRSHFNVNNSRGVTWWSDEKEKRILYVVGSYLYAVDAMTGEMISTFGDGGKKELHEGLGRDVSKLFVTATSPGMIYKDLYILGCRVSEGSDAAPGHIRAYDVRTGEQKWIFHTIPHPGEVGFETWEDTTAYHHIGGANSWAGFSLDEKSGMLFAPTGSASFDFYGGKRKGANLFANSTIALDAATGKYIWHFQNIHHDIWDRDNPTPPSLVTVTHNGKKIDAIAQPTKTGFIFLLDRATGKPLFPVEEVPVPTNSPLKGEKLYPTQPIPSLPKPFMRQTFTEADLNDMLPDSSFQEIRSRFLAARSGNMFVPLTPGGSIFHPGLDGGAEWGGAAYDPESTLMYINANEIPWLLASREVDLNGILNESMLHAGQRLYNQHCMACHGPDRKGSGNFPGITTVEDRYDSKAFDELITTGRRMMPGFASLSVADKNAIAAFVLDLKKEHSKKYEGAPIKIDSFRNLPYSLTADKFRSKEGYPAIKPPWGTLNAVNLNTGEIQWRIPFGENEFKKQGILTGTENYGGPVVTAGGLLFIGATPDGKFRAFNKKTGKLLWETDLPVPAFATPATYEINGKQFIVIACGGGKLNTQSGDVYIAFALP